VYGRTLRFGRRRRERDFDHRHEFRPLPEGDIFQSLFTDSCYIAMSSAMLRRTAVEVLGEMPAEIAIIPDYFLFVEVARNWRARAVQEVVCRYREHAGSLTWLRYREMHEEALWLVRRWASALPREAVADRLAIHHTLVALKDVMVPRTLPQGLWRLVRHGSIPFLLTRPLARSSRAIKRRLLRPFWQLAGRTASAAPTVPRVDVLGTRVTVSNEESMVRALAAYVDQRAGVYVSPINAYSATLAWDDPRYRAVLNGAAAVTADGMSVVWALRALGFAAGRVHNDDLFLACSERYRQWKHFLVGGREGQPAQVGAELQRRFPGFTVVGQIATPVRPVPSDQTDAIVEAIRSSGADIVWVGLGTPAQDNWMAEAAARAGVPMVGVGSAFDLLAGHTRATPEWMKQSGLQWLFRLVQEPQRLLFRYVYYNSRFVLACVRELRRPPALLTRGPSDQPASGPDLSVVIVSHNVRELLDGCLASVFRECEGLAVEVFVVDSASTDDTVENVRRRYPQVQVIARQDNVGFSAGNNLALRLCRGRHVVLLNPDTIVQPGGLRTLMQHLDDHAEAGAAGPTLRLASGDIQNECARHAPRVSNLVSWLLLLDKLEWFVRFRRQARATSHHPPKGTWLDRFSLLSWTRDRTCAVDCICGACLMVRREVIDEIGVLDETAPMYLDDIDFCRRIQRAGWQIHFVAEASITHLWKQSTGQVRREGDFFAMGCHSIWLYLRKHDGVLAASAFSLAAAFAGLTRLVLYTLVRPLPGRAGQAATRQWYMALALTRWALRVPKTAPRFDFAAPSKISAPGSPSLVEPVR
jgi:N-acetylglucosaminyldiphosphoundecaprenol N-acetyl-beta-D-mannosaminyltransferase